MNIHLTRELEAFISKKVASGRYSSASEVVREGLRLLSDDDEWKAEVRRKIGEGLADLKAGRVVDGAKAVAGIRSTIKTARRRKRA